MNQNKDTWRGILKGRLSLYNFTWALFGIMLILFGAYGFTDIPTFAYLCLLVAVGFIKCVVKLSFTVEPDKPKLP